MHTLHHAVAHAMNSLSRLPIVKESARACA